MSNKKRDRPGRPPIDPLLKKIPAGYKLPRWLTCWMREQETPAAQIIENAIRTQHDLAPPIPQTTRNPKCDQKS